VSTVAIEVDVVGGVPGWALAAMEAGLSRVGAGGTDVVVTSNFAAVVQARSGEPYDATRIGGEVGARALNLGDARVVVVNWPVVSDPEVEYGPAELERLLAHEAAHTVHYSRGEGATVGDWEFPGNMWDSYMIYAARIAIDEYRSEATVYQAGYPVEFSRSDAGIVDWLFGLNRALWESVEECFEHLDVERLRNEVLTQLMAAVRFMGCTIARHLHYAPIDPTEFNVYAQANWADYIEPTWDDFVEFYAAIPPADRPFPAADADAAASKALQLLVGFTHSCGFAAGGADPFEILAGAVDFVARSARIDAEGYLVRDAD
jgi:hypothetical protein